MSQTGCRGLNERDNLTLGLTIKKITSALPSNCLALAVRGKEVPPYPPVTGWWPGLQSIQQSIRITQLLQASGPTPVRWDARQFLPHHNHSTSNCRGSSAPCVHQGKGKNSTTASAAKAACAGSPTATPHKASQGIYPTQSRRQTSWRLGSPAPPREVLLCENRPCCNTRATSRGTPEAHHIAVRCGNRQTFLILLSIPSHKYFQPQCQ